MVRILIPLGWLGAVILAFASYSGYAVEPESGEASRHILSALLSAAPLLLVYLSLVIYLVGTRRLVGDSRARGSELEERYRSVTGRSLVACSIGAIPLLMLFASGLPTHTASLDPTIHHGLAYGALGCQVMALGWLGRSVGKSETLLGEVAAAEYNDGVPEPPSG